MLSRAVVSVSRVYRTKSIVIYFVRIRITFCRSSLSCFVANHLQLLPTNLTSSVMVINGNNRAETVYVLRLLAGWILGWKDSLDLLKIRFFEYSNLHYHVVLFKDKPFLVASHVHMRSGLCWTHLYNVHDPCTELTFEISWQLWT